MVKIFSVFSWSKNPLSQSIFDQISESKVIRELYFDACLIGFDSKAFAQMLSKLDNLEVLSMNDILKVKGEEKLKYSPKSEPFQLQEILEQLKNKTHLKMLDIRSSPKEIRTRQDEAFLLNTKMELSEQFQILTENPKILLPSFHQPPLPSRVFYLFILLYNLTETIIVYINKIPHFIYIIIL